jgi:DNA repair protein RecO (recombination protein O)
MMIKHKRQSLRLFLFQNNFIEPASVNLLSPAVAGLCLPIAIGSLHRSVILFSYVELSLHLCESFRLCVKTLTMSQRLHKTKGIVLRTVKYGETSIIVTIFTEMFGIQSYIVNGVRASTKKGAGKANLFQPSAILDLIVYHNELRNLQRIKEFKWSFLYQHILSDIKKNAVALFMVELLTKCLKQPEANEDLFHFAEDAFLHLDESNEMVTANFPLFFALHLAVFFGVLPNPLKGTFQDSENLYFDLKEGNFTCNQPDHPHFLEGRQAHVTA